MVHPALLAHLPTWQRLTEIQTKLALVVHLAMTIQPVPRFLGQPTFEFKGVISQPIQNQLVNMFNESFATLSTL